MKIRNLLKRYRHLLLMALFALPVLIGLIVYSSKIGDMCTVSARLILGGGLVLLLALVVCAVHFRIRSEWIMAVILLFAMLAMFFICPFDETPDWNVQWFRSFAISEGQLVAERLDDSKEWASVGSRLPKNVELVDDPEAELEDGVTSLLAYDGMALYSPVCHCLQALGIRIGRLFTNRVQALSTIARAFSAAGSFALCLLALRIAPFGKRILFVVMMFPYTIQQMSSISADGITVALCLLYIAYVLHLAYRAPGMRRRDVAVLAVLTILVAQMKIVYAGLALLVFLIPNAKFSGKKAAIALKIGMIVVALALSLCWLRIASGLLTARMEGIDGAAQVAYIFQNPLRYLKIAGATCLKRVCDWSMSLIGNKMGIYDVRTCSLVVPICCIVLAFELLAYPDVQLRDVLGRGWMLLVFAAVSALILTAEYVQWTTVGNDIIEGVQGRYFTPILPLLLMFVASFRGNMVQRAGIDPGTQMPMRYGYLPLIFVNGLAMIDMIAAYGLV